MYRNVGRPHSPISTWPSNIGDPDETSQNSNESDRFRPAGPWSTSPPSNDPTSKPAENIHFYLLDRIRGVPGIEQRALSHLETKLMQNLQTWYFSATQESPLSIQRLVCQLVHKAIPDVYRVSIGDVGNYFKGTKYENQKSTMIATLTNAKKAFLQLTQPDQVKTPVRDPQAVEFMVAFNLGLPDPPQVEFATKKEYMVSLVEQLRNPNFPIPDELVARYKNDRRFAKPTAEYLFNRKIPIVPFNRLPEPPRLDVTNTNQHQDASIHPSTTQPSQNDTRKSLKRPHTTKPIPANRNNNQGHTLDAPTVVLGENTRRVSAPKSALSRHIRNADFSQYLLGTSAAAATTQRSSGPVSNGGGLIASASSSTGSRPAVPPAVGSTAAAPKKSRP
jgi:hypothetical protein